MLVEKTNSAKQIYVKCLSGKWKLKVAGKEGGLVVATTLLAGFFPC